MNSLGGLAWLGLAWLGIEIQKLQRAGRSPMPHNFRKEKNADSLFKAIQGQLQFHRQQDL